jgi:osmotically-inducible protein OsmY
MTYLQLTAPPPDGVQSQWKTVKHQHEIERAAQAALRRSSYLWIRDVECQYDDGVLTLRGRLPSFFLKQMAQCTVSHRLRGSAIVNNQLEVMQPTHGVATWPAP